MATLTGHAAIDYAETHGLVLSKYADPIEGAREGLTVQEARAVAAQDPQLIYVVDVEAPIHRERGGGRAAKSVKAK